MSVDYAYIYIGNASSQSGSAHIAFLQNVTMSMKKGMRGIELSPIPPEDSLANLKPANDHPVYTDVSLDVFCLC